MKCMPERPIQIQLSSICFAIVRLSVSTPYVFSHLKSGARCNMDFPALHNLLPNVPLFATLNLQQDSEVRVASQNTATHICEAFSTFSSVCHPFIAYHHKTIIVLCSVAFICYYKGRAESSDGYTRQSMNR